MGSLNSDLQLDNNLKPLKSGEELSSLELSTKGNGARITGDVKSAYQDYVVGVLLMQG